MLKFWKLFDGQTLFFEAPDSGGGGGDGGDGGDAGDGGDGGGEASDGLEHPDFKMPGGTDDGAAGDGGGEGDQGGQEGGGAARKPKPKGAVESVPKHRLDEVIRSNADLKRQLANLEAENKRFKGGILASLGVRDPDAPAEPKQLTDRERAIQKRLMELIPGLGNLDKLSKLVEKSDVLESLVASVPEFTKQNERYWDQVAKTMAGAMETALAPLLLGEGKTAKDLSKDQQLRFRREFAAWVQGSDERIDRYESLDSTLVDDFVKELEDMVVAPLRRRYGADTLNRSGNASRLPVGGNSSAPVGSRKPNEKKALSEDDAADAAWKNFKERVAAN